MEKLTFNFRCPRCGFVNRATLQQVKLEDKILCSGCHVEIFLKDNEGSVQRDITDIEKALNYFERTLKKLIKKA